MSEIPNASAAGDEVPTEVLVAKLSPWRHFLADAALAGVSWEQLAKEVSAKPDFGLLIAADRLKACVLEAFVAAGETMPGA
jgi:hypothetical protein